MKGGHGTDQDGINNKRLLYYLLYYFAVEVYYQQLTPVDKIQTYRICNFLIVRGYEAEKNGANDRI